MEDATRCFRKKTSAAPHLGGSAVDKRANKHHSTELPPESAIIMTDSTTAKTKSRIRVTLTAQILGAVGGALAVLAIVGVTAIVQLGALDSASRA